ncbi:MAG: hypothetical protein A3K19_29520 [Lentisphaerae bacterium RIFOXYB12_FULL_65_16]|nr:MAG: hypothetical protein A3K18_03810 [Lentisphaerae bacterium RIFOXYA12_64_32]OGV92987.1 MAG: hypothetical protein A3K19_29520 [Lentisphaerae bacterium RIFOXYB12_FULL_65_16]
MKTIRLAVVGLLGAVAMLTLSGCAMMDSMYQGTTKMVHPSKMQLKSDVKWMKPQPPLREVSGNDMSVYLRLRNTSASPAPVDVLQAKVRTGLQAAGYRVVDDKDQAHFSMNVDVRAYGENENVDYGAGVLAGAVIGGVGGAVAGHAIRQTGTSTGLGAAAGAAVVGGAAAILANRNPMVEIDLVVDLRIGERIQGGAQTTRQTEGNQTVNQVQSATVAGGHEGGASKGGSSERQQVEVREDFLYHENRLVAHAVKMRLTPEEALPVLTDKMSAALSSVLP